MNQDVLSFAQVMAIVVASTGSFIAIGLATRYLWRLTSPRNRELSSAQNDRLDRLEQSIDAIAIEVERISEAQRYTVAVLSERLPARADERVGLNAPRVVSPKFDTPH